MDTSHKYCAPWIPDLKNVRKMYAFTFKKVRHTIKALFLNLMQLVPPFYDENWRRSIDLKYEKENIGKLMKKKKKKYFWYRAQSFLKVKEVVHTVWVVSQDAILLILAQLH